MREILFKAKRIDNGKWVEGYLFDDGFENGRMFVGGLIIEEYKGTACDEWDITGIDFYEVDPSTICQYTGLTDKNGKKIWENDILKMHSGDLYNDNVIVKYEKSAFVAISKNLYQRVFHIYEKKTEHTGRAIYDVHFDYEVIGNVFDNPELLENEVK